MFCILFDNKTYEAKKDNLVTFTVKQKFTFKEGDLAFLYVTKSDCSLINLYSLTSFDQEDCLVEPSLRHEPQKIVFGSTSRRLSDTSLTFARNKKEFMFQGLLLHENKIKLKDLIEYGKAKKKVCNFFRRFSEFNKLLLSTKREDVNVFELTVLDKNLLIEFVYGPDTNILSVNFNTSAVDIKDFEKQPKIVIPKEISVSKLKRIFLNVPHGNNNSNWVYILRVKDVMIPKDKEFWKICVKKGEYSQELTTETNPFSVELFFAVPIQDPERILTYIEKLKQDYKNPYQKVVSERQDGWVLMSLEDLKTHVIYFIH